MPDKFSEHIFRETGALKEGHFLLASGLHSKYYFQAQALLQYPGKASEVGAKIAEEWKNSDIDAAVSLALGGVVLGQEISRKLGCRHIFLERKQKDFILGRGFNIEKGEKILVVEDVVTTGGSVREALEITEKYKADIKGICALLQRGETEFKYPFKPLLKVNWPAYKPAGCPLCKKGIPLHTAGTKQSKKTSRP